jgi:hypothetical protein
VTTIFNKADIERGKVLVKNLSNNQYALGELANKIEKQYESDSLGEFANAIGINYNTLKGYRYVWRRWEESKAKPRNFSVAKALASYKNRDQYIKQYPNATEEEARAYVKKERKDAREKKDKEMLDSEKKGYKFGNWEKRAHRLLKDMRKHVTEKWPYILDRLVERKEGLEERTIQDLVWELGMSATMLARYKEKFMESTALVEYERTPIE